MTAVVGITTVNDLVRYTLRASGIFGVGQDPLADDYADAINTFNMMIGTWNAQRWLNFHTTDNAFGSTGAQSYTVGPSGNFNISPRPEKLVAAFARQIINAPPNQVDYGLSILQSREDYNRIALKTLGTWPQWIFYDPAWPLGMVYPWPVPQAAIFELHLTFADQLTQYTSTVQGLNVPPEYLEVMWTNLAVRLAPIYQFQLDPTIVALAVNGLAMLRANNAQIPRLMLPIGVRARRGRYNVYSDSSGQLPD